MSKSSEIDNIRISLQERLVLSDGIVKIMLVVVTLLLTTGAMDKGEGSFTLLK